MNDVTQILSQIEQGDPTAAEQLLPLVYQELRKLAAENEVRAELVKLRYFAGLTLTEAAAVLGVSRATAARHWTYAKAWLDAQWKMLARSEKVCPP